MRIGRDVEVKRSAIHGQGLFALRAFTAGETVLRWDLSHLLPKEELASLPEQERVYTHPFDEKRVMIVQPPERYVNHSCENNTVVRDFRDVAIRDINAGEEITSDYSADGSGLKFRCCCGTKACRGSVG
jgi:SET domain-containing protein